MIDSVIFCEFWRGNVRNPPSGVGICIYTDLSKKKRRYQSCHFHVTSNARSSCLTEAVHLKRGRNAAVSPKAVSENSKNFGNPLVKLHENFYAHFGTSATKVSAFLLNLLFLYHAHYLMDNTHFQKLIMHAGKGKMFNL